MEKNKKKYVMGIDPGLNGGVIVLDENKKIIRHLIFNKEDFVLKLQQFNSILQDTNLKNMDIFLEQVHALYKVSAASTFTFGTIVGLIKGCIIANDKKFIEIQPKLWQKSVYSTIPSIKQVVESKIKVDTKKLAMSAFLEVNKKEDELKLFQDKPRSKKLNDGLIDAYLIALYGFNENEKM